MKEPSCNGEQNRWALILAGGEGTRLKPLTRVISGDDRPKQFCSIFGENTLLDEVCGRAQNVVPKSRTLVVVDRSHKRYYQQLFKSDTGSQILLEQPTNKGTAAAIILGLLRIARLSPGATVAIFPIAHYIGNDGSFTAQMESAFTESRQAGNDIVLFGITPERVDGDQNWIELDVFVNDRPSELSRVRRFWKRPTETLTRELVRRGCLLNSFVMIGRVDAFLALAQRALPTQYECLVNAVNNIGTSDTTSDLDATYASIQASDFFSEVIALSPRSILVKAVSGLDWCDLAEPSRALSVIQKHLALSSETNSERKADYKTSISFLRMHYEALARTHRATGSEQIL